MFISPSCRGPLASASAEEIFTPTGLDASVTVQQRVGGAWYALGTVRHIDQSITADTRDHLFMPTRGRWITMTYARSTAGLLSDFNYARVRLDARAYRAKTAAACKRSDLLSNRSRDRSR